MFRRQWLQFLSSLGLEFWLPLPLLGLCFWLMSGWLADRNLNRSYQTMQELQIPQETNNPPERVLSIKVIIDRDRNISQVKVKQVTSLFQTQEFQLSTIKLDRVEAEIGQKLGLSVEQVQQLSRYQIEE
jgi:hypothetical protein